MPSLKRSRSNQSSSESSDEEQTQQVGKRSRANASSTSSDKNEKLDSVIKQTIDGSDAVSHLETMTSKVFDYSFIMMLLLDYLTDHEVLINLVRISKAVNRSVLRYPLKRAVDHNLADRINRTSIVASEYTLTFTIPNSRRLTIISAKLDDFAPVDWLSSSIRTLERKMIDPRLNEPFPSHIRELTLVKLLFENSSDEVFQISPGMLPANLKSLKTDFSILMGSLPPSLVRLYWDKPTCPFDVGLIPKTVTDLTITGEGIFSKDRPPLTQGHFPDGLIKLTIKCNLLANTRLVHAIIPSTVKNLTLDHVSERSSTDFLPLGLERLELLFTPPLSRSFVIPRTVTELVYEGSQEPLQCYVTSLRDLLPSLRVLDLGGYTNRLDPGGLPSTLRSLTMSGNNGKYPLKVGVIPHGVSHLRLLRHTTAIHGFKPINAGVIPTSVVHLEWDYGRKTQLVVGSIPSSVTTLVFGPAFNREVPVGFIPDSVRSLTFGDSFNNDEKRLKRGIIPFGVKYLRFGKSFDNALAAIKSGVIPSTVTHLYFPRSSKFYNGRRWLSSAIPDSVVVLELPQILRSDPVAERR